MWEVSSLFFFIDTGATYSVLVQHSSLTCLSKITGIEAEPKLCLQTSPLTCKYENQFVSHSFLVLCSCPSPLLGRDPVFKLESQFKLIGQEDGLFSLRVEEKPGIHP